MNYNQLVKLAEEYHSKTNQTSAPTYRNNAAAKPRYNFAGDSVVPGFEFKPPWEIYGDRINRLRQQTQPKLENIFKQLNPFKPNEKQGVACDNYVGRNC